MAKSINKAILVGNVGQDPEVRATQSGTKVAKFSLATNNKWKDRDGNAQERVEWHRITCWGKLAEIVEQYVHKGDRLYVEGRIEYTTVDNADGTKKYFTDIQCQEIMFCGNAQPNGGQQQPAAQQQARQAPPAQQAQRQAPPAQQQHAAPLAAPGNNWPEDMDF